MTAFIDRDDWVVVRSVAFRRGYGPDLSRSGGEYAFFLFDESGGVPLQFTLVDPKRCYDCPAQRVEVEFEVRIELPARVARLRMEEYGTGKVKFDLDLRGHMQILCMNQPCLSICQPRGTDGGTPDGNGADAGAAVDGDTSVAEDGAPG